MFLLRISRAAAKPYIQRQVLTRRCLVPTIQSISIRHLHQSHVTLPTAKEPEAIVPLLDSIETKTAVTYNSILKTLALEGRSQQAQKLYDIIFRHHDVKADIDTYSQLMLAYMNDGRFEDAMEIYYEIRDHDEDPDKNLRFGSEMYASMIHSLTDPKTMKMSSTQFDNEQEPMYEYSVEDVETALYPDIDGDSQPSMLTALALFNDMRHLEIQPTPSMYSDMLRACAMQKDSYVLEKVHKLVRMDLYLDPDTEVFNQLMKAYQAVGDPASVLEIWDVAESSNVLDQKSVSVALQTCLQYGCYTRADAIWNTMQSMGDTSFTSVETFNTYLKCVLKTDEDRARELIEKGLSAGQANETSVNILKEHTATTAAV